MKCKILHESSGSMRIHVMTYDMSMDEADILEYYFKNIEEVSEVKVFDQTGDAIIRYSCAREKIIRALSSFTYEENAHLVPEHTGRALNREFQTQLVSAIAWKYIKDIFIPAPIKHILTIIESVKFIIKGLKSLIHRKLDVSVLDASAIAVACLRSDFDTAASIMFLLGIGDLLEEWTHKKSVGDLARTMSLNVDKVWIKSDGQEILVPVNDVQEGSLMIMRTSNMIPLDGRVVSGEAMINQASITGESLPVHKTAGGAVYAGTVVDEGECIIEVTKANGGGRYDRIVRMIEESEKLKSSTETKAFHLADRLVPYNLGGTVITWLLTRDVTRALSFLMVDFSCALKLAMPISVLSAMNEAQKHDITVKGGKFMEAVSEARTVVFDKTGTLTHSNPTLAKIVTFDGHTEDDMLRLAACLEEHYPHSIANAVVEEAKRRDLRHEERHTKVEYVVAHGIASMVDDEKAVIGSYHFVFEDENCTIDPEEQEKFDNLPNEYSHLYLALGGKLAAVLLIEDPLREEAPGTIAALHELGIDKIVMMTGDSERTARAIAAKVGVDEYYAEVLPEDKAAFIKSEHEQGRKIIMIGDGINDSPALSEADAGIAASEGAAIARDVADITIPAENLYNMVILKLLSDRLMKRIHSNYRFIIGFNMSLIGLGVLGILAPATSALFHNLSTIAIGIKSMTPLLTEDDKEKWPM